MPQLSTLKEMHQKKKKKNSKINFPWKKKQPPTQLTAQEMAAFEKNLTEKEDDDWMVFSLEKQEDSASTSSCEDSQDTASSLSSESRVDGSTGWEGISTGACSASSACSTASEDWEGCSSSGASDLSSSVESSPCGRRRNKLKEKAESLWRKITQPKWKSGFSGSSHQGIGGQGGSEHQGHQGHQGHQLGACGGDTSQSCSESASSECLLDRDKKDDDDDGEDEDEEGDQSKLEASKVARFGGVVNFRGTSPIDCGYSTQPSSGYGSMGPEEIEEVLEDSYQERFFSCSSTDTEKTMCSLGARIEDVSGDGDEESEDGPIQGEEDSGDEEFHDASADQEQMSESVPEHQHNFGEACARSEMENIEDHSSADLGEVTSACREVQAENQVSMTPRLEAQTSSVNARAAEEVRAQEVPPPSASPTPPLTYPHLNPSPAPTPTPTHTHPTPQPSSTPPPTHHHQTPPPAPAPTPTRPNPTQPASPPHPTPSHSSLPLPPQLTLPVPSPSQTARDASQMEDREESCPISLIVERSCSTVEVFVVVVETETLRKSSAQTTISICRSETQEPRNDVGNGRQSEVQIVEDHEQQQSISSNQVEEDTEPNPTSFPDSTPDPTPTNSTPSSGFYQTTGSQDSLNQAPKAGQRSRTTSQSKPVQVVHPIVRSPGCCRRPGHYGTRPRCPIENHGPPNYWQHGSRTLPVRGPPSENYFPSVDISRDPPDFSPLPESGAIPHPEPLNLQEDSEDADETHPKTVYESAGTQPNSLVGEEGETGPETAYDPNETRVKEVYDPDETSPKTPYDPDETSPKTPYDPNETSPKTPYDPDETSPKTPYDPDETIPKTVYSDVEETRPNVVHNVEASELETEEENANETRGNENEEENES